MVLCKCKNTIKKGINTSTLNCPGGGYSWGPGNQRLLKKSGPTVHGLFVSPLFSLRQWTTNREVTPSWPWRICSKRSSRPTTPRPNGSMVSRLDIVAYLLRGAQTNPPPPSRHLDIPLPWHNTPPLLPLSSYSAVEWRGCDSRQLRCEGTAFLFYPAGPQPSLEVRDL